MSYWRGALAMTAAVGALLAAPALADTRVVAAAVDRFVNPAATIAAGETLVFANQDPLQKHTLTAVSNGPDGKPLFSTAPIGGNAVVPVTGTASLPPGTYDFYCTIHPAQMRGVLTVTAGASGDTTAPELLARLGIAARGTVLERGHLFATISLTEASTVVLNVRGRSTTVANTTVNLKAGTSRVQLDLTPKGRKALTGHKNVHLSLSVRATDAAGNQARVVSRATLAH